MLQQLAILLLITVSCNSYSMPVAHNMSYMSDIAYMSLASINAWDCNACKQYPVKNQKAFFSSTGNIQGYAAHYTAENAILISFRGSVDFKNWLYNLDTVSVGYPGCSGCNVHQGFYNGYKAISPLVKTQMNRLMSLYRNPKIIITGHSLGGALAVLCALQMKEIYGKVDYVYTFGQPRVGNQNFANFYQAQIPNAFRVINYADTVPHVPPSAFSFKHGGHEIWYNPRGMKTYKICVSEDPTCANSISATSFSTDDHQLANYQKLAINSQLLQNFKQIINSNLKKQENSIYTAQELQQAQVRKVQQIKELIGAEINQQKQFMI